MKLHCFKCFRVPSAIDEYVQGAAEYGITPDEFVMEEEGTLTPGGRFCCTECYIELGMPSSPEGWKP